jgi:tetratricopeptide (TPR) repeat protein
VCYRFSWIFWVDGSTHETSVQGFRDIAEAVGCKIGIEDARLWLANTNYDWLLILDNASSHFSIDNILPAGDHGSVLITTQHLCLKKYATVGCSNFKQLGVQSSVELLLKVAGENPDQEGRKQARQISETLGCLPLALVQAGVFISHKRSSLQSYSSDFHKYRAEIMQTHLGQDISPHGATTYSAFKMSRQAIESLGTKESLDAIKILDLSAFLHYQNIPQELFQKNSDIYAKGEMRNWITSILYGPSDSDFLGIDEFRIRQAISLLHSYSFAVYDRGRGMFSIHPLIHAWAKDRLGKDEQVLGRELAMKIMADSITWEMEADRYYFRKCLLTHIECCLGGLETGGETVPPKIQDARKARIFAKFALILSEHGKYNLAESILQQSLVQLRWPLFQPFQNNPVILCIMHHLTWVLNCMGSYGKAKSLAMEAVKRGKRMGESQREATLKTMSSLALICLNLGSYDEAIEIGRNVLEQREMLLGKDHDDTIESLSNLASILESKGMLKEAERICRDTLDRQMERLGQYHPRTLNTLSYLARTLQAQQRYTDAEAFMNQVLDTKDRALGPLHPDTLASISDMGTLQSQQNKLTLADKYYQRALEGYTQVFGREHPETLIIMSNIATILRRQRNYSLAERMIREILIIREKVLPRDHPDTLRSLSNLGVALGKQEKYEEAIEIYRRVLPACETTLGKDHDQTLNTLGNLAMALQHQEQYKEAELLSREALKRYEGALEQRPFHESALRVTFLLAETLHAQRKFGDAFICYQKACSGYESKQLTSSTSKICFKRFLVLQEEMKEFGLQLPPESTQPIIPSGSEQKDMVRVGPVGSPLLKQITNEPELVRDLRKKRKQALKSLDDTQGQIKKMRTS